MSIYTQIITLASNNIRSRVSEELSEEKTPSVDLFTASEVLGVTFCKDPRELMFDLLRVQGIIWNESTTDEQLAQLFFDI